MNDAEEAVVEELKSCLESATVVPEQGIVATATSCFRVFSSYQSCYRQSDAKVMNSIAKR